MAARSCCTMARFRFTDLDPEAEVDGCEGKKGEFIYQI